MIRYNLREDTCGDQDRKALCGVLDYDILILATTPECGRSRLNSCEELVSSIVFLSLALHVYHIGVCGGRTVHVEVILCHKEGQPGVGSLWFYENFGSLPPAADDDDGRRCSFDVFMVKRFT